MAPVSRCPCRGFAARGGVVFRASGGGEWSWRPLVVPGVGCVFAYRGGGGRGVAHSPYSGDNCCGLYTPQ